MTIDAPYGQGRAPVPLLGRVLTLRQPWAALASDARGVR